MKKKGEKKKTLPNHFVMILRKYYKSYPAEIKRGLRNYVKSITNGQRQLSPAGRRSPIAPAGTKKDIRPPA